MLQILVRIWHWLTETNNPFDLYGFYPAFLWTIAMIVVAFTFAMLETAGIKRYHDMIPLTWYWRCAPRWIWFAIAGIGIWHFAIVQTVVKVVKSVAGK